LTAPIPLPPCFGSSSSDFSLVNSMLFCPVDVSLPLSVVSYSEQRDLTACNLRPAPSAKMDSPSTVFSFPRLPIFLSHFPNFDEETAPRLRIFLDKKLELERRVFSESPHFTQHVLPATRGSLGAQVPALPPFLFPPSSDVLSP